jgi:hypothetical protein
MTPKLYMYRFIGSGNCHGPFLASDLQAARKHVRTLWEDDFREANERMRFEVWQYSGEGADAPVYASPHYAAE